MYSVRDAFYWSEPRHADLVGTWTLTSEGATFLKGHGYHVDGAHELRLNPDGTFTATGLPDCFLSLKPKGAFDSGSGVWRVEKPNWHWHITFGFDKVNKDRKSFQASAPLEGQKPPYLIHFTFGEPDNDLYYRFAREGDARRSP